MTKRQAAALMLLLITLLGFGLRIYGIRWGLPTETECLRSYHPDEPIFIQSIKYVQNPFRYPHFNLVMGTWHLYATGAAVKLGSMLGFFTLTGDRGYYEHHLAELDNLYLSGRLLSVVMGTLCIPLIFWLGTIYYNRAAGLLAALFLSVTAIHVIDSHYCYTGVPVLFWALLAWVCIANLQMRDTVRKRDLVGAGFFTALATMVQFNAGLLLFFIPVAVWLRSCSGREPMRLTWLRIALWGGGAFVIGTIIACPNMWFDPFGFYKQFAGYFMGHFGGEKKVLTNYQGRAIIFYGQKAMQEGFGTLLGGCVILGLIGAAFRACRRRGADLFMLAFVAANFLLMAKNDTYMLHYGILSLPALLLPAAALLGAVKSRTLALLLVLTVFTGAFCYTLAYDRLLARPDIRTQTSRWLEANVEPGTTLGVSAIYFYSVPAVQRLTGSPFDVREYMYDREKLAAEKPEYFLLCDFEFGIAGRALDLEYLEDIGSGRFLQEIRESGEYELVKEFYQPAELFGIDWTPPNPSWHWRYSNPRLWLYKRTEQ